MVRNREEAAQAAERSSTNDVGMCQLWTRSWFDAPSAGDQDHDGDADAVDGWLSEPQWARHAGDRNPARGVPVSFKDRHGHRAMSLGNGKIRSTDMDPIKGYAPGHVGTVTIDQIERSLNVTYVGWSETIDGILIPLPPAQKLTRVQKFLQGPPYDVKLLDRSIEAGRTGVVKDVRDAIDHQVRRLRQVEGSPRVNRFLQIYSDTRVMRMGFLRKAINAGRTGIVKDARAKIMVQIHKLPER